MKRYLIIALLVGVIGILAITGAVYAQRPTPSAPGQGWGMMGGQGGMMGGRGGMMGGAGQGLMHEYMQAELAAKLGLSEADLEKTYSEGQTFWQIAQDKGFTTEQAQQIMVDARSAALDKMVADGKITQEQADWMKNHMSGATGMMGGGGCMGGGNVTGGFRGGRNSGTTY